MIMRKIFQLTQILEKDENGRPILKLKSLKETVVNLTTERDYLKLMKILERGKLKGLDGIPPTNMNLWLGKNTCVTVDFDAYSNWNGDFDHGYKERYIKKNYDILSFREYCYEQSITPEMLKEINDCFEERKQK